MLEAKLHRAQQAVADAYETEITPRQFAILSYLADHEGGSQTAVTSATGIDRSTMAQVASTLAQRKFISRYRVRGDARTYTLKLTAAGKAALKTARALVANADRKILARLDEDARLTLISALDAIAS